MKVAWFTPFGVASAIGEFSDHVTRALAEHCDVEIWLADVHGRRRTELPVRDFGADPRILNELGDRDLCVYNMGDHLGYHGALYDASQHHPGVIVLHDRIYHHLVVAYWVMRGEPYRLMERTETLYGSAGRRFLQDLLTGRRSADRVDDPDVLRFPFAEELLVGARGAVVHSAGQGDSIRNRWFGPVAALPFPAYPPAGLEVPDNAPSTAASDTDRVLLVTVGYVNPNKQIDRVVRVLAADRELASRVRYVVAGPYDPSGSYWPQLQNLIDETGLGSSVELLGYRPDSELARLMASAAAFVNLRFPSLEGGSASLMQELILGKAVVVNDVGTFGELPRDAALKVPPDDDGALARALRTVVFDEETRRRIGEGARRAASERTPARYAEELLAFAEEALEWSPVLALCDRVSAELSAIGVGTDFPAIETVAEQLAPIVEREVRGERHTAGAVFRELARADEEALARFLLRNNVPEVVSTFDPFPFDGTTAAKIAHRHGKDRYYAAFADGELVGLSMLRGWDEGYEVPSFGIAVDAQFHGRGIGSRLTDWTIEQARRLGSSTIRLSVYGRNERAHRMYSERGFREISREPVERAGVADERIVMVKELAAESGRESERGDAKVAGMVADRHAP